MVYFVDFIDFFHLAWKTAIFFLIGGVMLTMCDFPVKGNLAEQKLDFIDKTWDISYQYLAKLTYFHDNYFKCV